MTTQRNFKGVWLPAALWLTDELNINEKVLLVEIDSLQDPVKGCYKSNKAFAEFFGLSASRVSELVSNLQKKGFVKIKQLTKGKQVIQRQLFLTPKLSKLVAEYDTRKTEGGYSESRSPYSESRRGYSENTEERGNSLGVTGEGESAHATAPDLDNPEPQPQPTAESANAGADEPPLAGLTLGNHAMYLDWQPAAPELVPLLRRSAIALPVCECLAADPELIAGFVNHQLANPGREYSSTGWTSKLATWLIRDWQRLGRPTSAAEYHQNRGTRPANLPQCPLDQLHALWEQELGHLKPTPPLADWLKSKSAKRLADRWADGFTAPLADDPQSTRYQDTQTGLDWWQGLFQAIASSDTLAKDDWFSLIHLGNLDTFADVTARLTFESQQGGAR